MFTGLWIVRGLTLTKGAAYAEDATGRGRPGRTLPRAALKYVPAHLHDDVLPAGLSGVCAQPARATSLSATWRARRP